MQEYDEIKKILKFAEDLTDNISKMLNSDIEHDIKKIFDLYKKREGFVKKLKNLSESDDITEKIKELDWNNRINRLILKDKDNLIKLKQITNDKGNEIKNLMKRKSLLIYKD